MNTNIRQRVDGVTRHGGAAGQIITPCWPVVLLLSCFTVVLCRYESLQAGMPITVNQLGYRPHDDKIAFVRTGASGLFEVVDAVTNTPVYSGPISPQGIKDVHTGDTLYTLDFTGFTTPGRYRLRLPDSGSDAVSYEFGIDEDIYRDATLTTLESFYAQRCGAPVNLAGVWRHPLCHPHDAVLFDQPGHPRPVTGGWHDAGDYGKFVVTGAVSAALLLASYEQYPTKFTDAQLAIPEANNGVPDLLDEARWELQWLLTMQREDGGVYHKVSTKKWTGEYLPHKDPDPRYIFGVSSTATGDFAAVTAMGARVFSSFDPDFARRLLKASRQAWDFLTAHQGIVPSGGFTNPSGVEGGEYGDKQDKDERLWAAVELYRLTGLDEYHRYFILHYRQFEGYHNALSWQNVHNLAYASYLRLQPSARDGDTYKAIRSHLIRACGRLLDQIEQNGYRTALKDTEYYWGSNSVALGYAFDLIQAYEVTGDSWYREGALDQLHYILGRNTFNISLVTGIGAQPAGHPYHQFSMTLDTGQPVPGMVVGGPNRYGKLNGHALSPFPGKCYEDNSKNYFVNETAINYTAPFVYVVGYFSRLGLITME